MKTKEQTKILNLQRDVDEFTRAYIVTALWSSNDGENPPDHNYSWTDIADETLAQMVEDCRQFQEQNRQTIEDAINSDEGVKYGPDFGPWGRAGHDFWLTREGHGAGFWDGDWPEPYSEKLTDAAQAFGEFSLYIGDDGKIYR